MSEWVDVESVEGFPAGSHRVVEIDGVYIAVFNLDGEYYAIEDVCTHDGGTLTGGAIEGEEVICPRHGARFSVKSGKVLSPPAYEDIDTFPVRTHNGYVQVRDNRWD